MFRSTRLRNRFNITILFSGLLLIFSSALLAADVEMIETQKSKAFKIVVGGSIILKSAHPIKRVSIADPKVADFVLVSPTQIYITGKAVGVTNLSLWQNEHLVGTYDLEVECDIARLKETLHEVLPEEKELRVIATQNSITLSGRVSSTASLSQAMVLASAYAPGAKVHNLMEAGGIHQVMLEVRVAEMSRSLIKKLGINFNYVSGGEFGISSLGGLTQIVSPEQDIISSGGPFGLFVTPAINALFRFNRGSGTWTGFIDALKADGLVKILAEPTLIALSGNEARFLAGGEFPVPVPQGLGSVAIEYRAFGVGLSFTPTVLSEDKISIKVSPEVSELDFSTAVQFQGFVVPGLSVRKASTLVELSDGQSFAIAGLLRESVRDNLEKFPLLGEIPFLGALFRSRSFQKNETELVIIATPHLVKPIDAEKQTLPTDFYKEPDDVEFYIHGLMEGKGNDNASSSTRGKLDGDFGHAVPK